MEINEEKENFYMKQKTFFLTFPHCNLEKRAVFDFFLVKHKPEVVLVSQEPHKDGDYHFHVWLEFNKKIIIRNSRYFDIQDYHCNIGKIRNSLCNSRKNVIRYITKFDKEPLIFGCNIKDELKEHCIRRTIMERLIKGENLNKVILEYPQEIFNYDKYRKNINLFNLDRNKPNKIIMRKCFWLYGPSGIGKSYLVRNTFDNIYEKSNNVWWDGYNNEKTVLIDDFDKTCVKLSYYLKIWGDNYRFNGEIKGSIIQPIYNKLIITSNYNIEELFYDEEKPDIELVNALKRRFEEIYIYDKRQLEEVKEIIKKDYINRFLDLKIYKHNLI